MCVTLAHAFKAFPLLVSFLLDQVRIDTFFFPLLQFKQLEDMSFK